MKLKSRLSRAVLALALATPPAAFADAAADIKAVAALDTEYQAAVKRNDAATMARILHDDFVLVLGTGQTANKARLVKLAEGKEIVWEQQDEEPGSQVVRVWGDTAVVTAKLWVKNTRKGVKDDQKLWFSDTYIRTKTGWRYVFGQASLPLPATP